MFVCDDCGSENVQRKAWVDLNTESIHCNVEPFEEFCDDCQDHTKVTIVNKKLWELVNTYPAKRIVSDLLSIGIVTNNYVPEEVDLKIKLCHAIEAGKV